MAKKVKTANRKIQQNFSKFVKQVDEETKSAVREACQRVFDEAQSEVPVDTGALKESGRIEEKIKQAGFGVEIICQIMYGGREFPVQPTRNAREGIVDYASAVHELHDPWFLRAIQKVQPEIEGIVRQRLGKVARAGNRADRKA